MKIKTVILGYNNITQYYYFYCIFDQINPALLSIKVIKNIFLNAGVKTWHVLM